MAAAVVAGLLAAGLPAGESPRAADAPPAPSLRSLHGTTVDGHRWRGDSVAGKVVLVDFWATWCAPCLAELPELRRLREAHADAGFEIVGVSMDQLGRRELRSWLARHQVGWVQLHDRRGLDGPLPRRFGVETVPRSFLFDHRGRLVAVDLPAPALEATVEGLLEYASDPERTDTP